MNKLVFGDVEFGKKEFYEAKKGIKLKDVDVDKIVVSNNETSKIFIGYMMDDIVIPLCLLLRQVSGWIKYFENGVLKLIKIGFI